jgi:hypothetical protein
MTDATPTPAPAEKPAPRRARNTRAILAAALGVIAVAALALGLFAALTRQAGTGGEGLVFIIPAGTVVERPTIDSALEIPTDIRFKPGETAVITVRNDDRISHRAGPWVVAPGQTLVQRFPEPGSYFMACSVDPAESVTVTVEG